MRSPIHNRICALLGAGLLALCLLPAHSLGAAESATPSGGEVIPGLTLSFERLADGLLSWVAEPGAGPFQLRITKGEAAYLYHLNGTGDTTLLPLQLGEGPYLAEVFVPAGDGWERVFSTGFSLTLARPNGVFLSENLFVPIQADGRVPALARALTKNCRSPRKKVGILYAYVTEHIAYDAEKAAVLDGSYRPDPEATLAEGRGICLDYASLLAALCRSVGIPAKLVTGHLTDSGSYHAWNAVYYLGRWHRLDPTLGSAAGPGRNYTAERVY